MRLKRGPTTAALASAQTHSPLLSGLRLRGLAGKHAQLHVEAAPPGAGGAAAAAASGSSSSAPAVPPDAVLVYEVTEPGVSAQEMAARLEAHPGEMPVCLCVCLRTTCICGRASRRSAPRLLPPPCLCVAIGGVHSCQPPGFPMCPSPSHPPRPIPSPLPPTLPPLPAVDVAEPDHSYYPDVIPNDALWEPRAAHSGLWFLEQIGAPDAWGVTTGSSEVQGQGQGRAGQGQGRDAQQRSTPHQGGGAGLLAASPCLTAALPRHAPPTPHPPCLPVNPGQGVRD